MPSRQRGHRPVAKSPSSTIDGGALTAGDDRVGGESGMRKRLHEAEDSELGVRPGGRRRILIAVHGYPPTFTGGAERRAQRTAHALRDRGYDVRVLCVESLRPPGAVASWEDGHDDGIPVRRLSFDPSIANAPFQWSYDNPVVAEALQSLFGAWRPDLVHLFSGYLVSASLVREAHSAGIPVVVSLTDYWWYCHRITLVKTSGVRCDGPDLVECARCQAESFRRFRLPSRWLPDATNVAWRSATRNRRLSRALGVGDQERRRAILDDAMHLVSAFISPSQYLADFYVAHGVERQKLHVSRQGVELERRMPRVPSTTLRFGFIGQMKRHKGPDLLVRAWRQLTGSRSRSLRLYGPSSGDACYDAEIQRLLRTVQDARWMGEVQHEEIWPVLADLDVLVFPSRWVENSPNSILEAHAAGLPVVAARLGAMPELVHHEQDGLLFQPDSVEQLTVELQRLLDDPTLVERLASSVPKPRSVADAIDDTTNLYAQIWQEHSQR